MAPKSTVIPLPERLFQAQLSYEGKTGERLTRGRFAEMVGVSQPTASEWFTGTRLPSLEQVEAIARALGVSPAWIAFGEGVMLAGNHPPATATPPSSKTRAETKGRGRRAK